MVVRVGIGGLSRLVVMVKICGMSKLVVMESRGESIELVNWDF